MKNYDRRTLAESAAKNLTGRRCVIRDRKPAIVGRLGQASSGGVFGIIDIDPGLNDDLWLTVFLHECAHVKRHFDRLPKHLADLAPQSKRLTGLEAYTSSPAHPGYEKMEKEADWSASVWADYAVEKYRHYGDYETPELARKLASLIDYHPYHRTIDASVNRVVYKAIKNFRSRK